MEDSPLFSMRGIFHHSPFGILCDFSIQRLCRADTRKVILFWSCLWEREELPRFLSSQVTNEDLSIQGVSPARELMKSLS